MSELESVLRKLVVWLEEQGIAYVVMGGLAVRVHALPRPTNDIDFTIQLDRGRLPDVFRQAERMGLTVPEAYKRGWVDEVSGMPIVKLRYYFQDGLGVDVDVFLAESEFQNALIARRQSLEVDGLKCFVVSPEDLVLLKLIASRPRDLIDVQDILFTQGTLDTAYMRPWAKQLGIANELEKVLATKH